ncbi:MAG TPA: hypothetical protein ENN73_02655, partial [Firmicutes bacterium]|nr:hypothetical protein [Bacillota bacterium]
MLNRLIFSVLALLILFIPAAGDWTILIYAAADNGSEAVQIHNLNLAETVGSDTEMNILIQIDRWDGVSDPEAHWPDDQSNGNWTGARRYYVTKDDLNDTINSTLLQDLGEIDMADPEVFTDFLTWGASYYSAEHYVLFAVGYGYGWIGAFQDRGDPVNFPDGHYMELDEIASSLKAFKNFTGKNLDILFFDTCLMMNYEVLYTLSPYVDYIIGSEELATDENDMGTDKFLNQLKHDKSILPEVLVKNIVSVKPSAFNTLSGINSEHIPEVNRIFNDFIRELSCNDLTYQTDIIQGIGNNKVERFGHFPNRFADLLHFTKLAKGISGPGSRLDSLGADLIEAIETAVIANTTVEAIKPEAHGISFYFPLKIVVDGIFIDYSQEKEKYNQLSFSKENLWNRYLPDHRDDDSDPLCPRESGGISLKIYPNPVKLSGRVMIEG